jgi:hypothetical protein
MKILTKLAVASVLTLAAAPAFAASALDNAAPETLTQLERNAYLFTPDARPIAHGAQHVERHASVRAHAASEAYASSPAVGSVYDRFSVENQ